MEKLPKRLIEVKAFTLPRILHTKLIYLLLTLLVIVAISGWTVDSRAVTIPIFGFHDIIDTQNPAELPPKRLAFEADYTQQDLKKFLEYLVRENYWFLSSQDLYVYFIKKSHPIPREHLGKKPIMLTFDDGYKGVHTNGLPILKKIEEKYGKKVKFVLFVNPRFMGVSQGGLFLSHISCDELRQGYREGFYDIQSHGFAHKMLPLLKGKELESELSDAKTALRKCTSDLDRNKIVGAHIAYPFGSITRRVEKFLPKYYLTGYLYNDNLLRVNWLRTNYRISRIPVNRFTSPRRLLRIAKRASELRKIT